MELLANIDVDDLEKGVAFYTEAFSLKVGRRFGREGVELLGMSSPLYLLVKAAGTPAASGLTQARDYRRHWTPVHLDFVVPDVESAVKAAVAAGAVLEDPIETHKWGRIAHLADPFGHGICLLQFLGRGYDEIAG
ncbi:MAG TPA: VOC family protein [Gammaproteobacteria bacterium]